MDHGCIVQAQTGRGELRLKTAIIQEEIKIRWVQLVSVGNRNESATKEAIDFHFDHGFCAIVKGDELAKNGISHR